MPRRCRPRRRLESPSRHPFRTRRCPQSQRRLRRKRRPLPPVKSRRNQRRLPSAIGLSRQLVLGQPPRDFSVPRSVHPLVTKRHTEASLLLPRQLCAARCRRCRGGMLSALLRHWRFPRTARGERAPQPQRATGLVPPPPPPPPHQRRPQPTLPLLVCRHRPLRPLRSSSRVRLTTFHLTIMTQSGTQRRFLSMTASSPPLQRRVEGAALIQRRWRCRCGRTHSGLACRPAAASSAPRH